MDVAQETFEKRGIGYASIRGDQSAKSRKDNISAFLEDPEVEVIVCSLTAAGVGINLQVASNVVLAEALLDLGRADAGHRPRPPHRPDRAGHRVADHRRADDRLAARPGSSTTRPGSPPVRSTAPTRRSGRRRTSRLEALVSLLTDALEKERAVALPGGPDASGGSGAAVSTGAAGSTGAADDAASAPLAAPSPSPFSPFSPFSAS